MDKHIPPPPIVGLPEKPKQYIPPPPRVGDPTMEMIDSYLSNRSEKYIVDKSKHKNLIYKIKPSVRDALASNLLDAIQQDEDSKQEWFQTMAKGEKQLGISGEEETDDRAYDGSSTVFSSALCKAWLNISQSLSSEMLPAGGPAKPSCLGDASDEKEERAERIADFTNYYVTEDFTPFYSELRQAISMAVKYGSGFVKSYIDPVLKKPVTFKINPTNLIVNTAYTSLASAERITEFSSLTSYEFYQRIKSGFYIDDDITPSENDNTSATNPLQQEYNKIEGSTANVGSYNYAKKYSMAETHTYLNLGDYIDISSIMDDKIRNKKPYRVHIERNSRKLLAIYQNWEEEDSDFKPINYYTPLNFINGYGIFGLGLFHLVGSSAKCATDIKRILINASELFSFPGGLISNSYNNEYDNLKMGPFEFVPIETGGRPVGEIISKAPYNEPPQILYQILGDVEQSIMDVSGATSPQIADINTNMPVGTIRSIIEESQKIQNTVVQGMHESFRRIFSIYYRLFSKIISEDGYEFHSLKKTHLIKRSDFKNDTLVIPVNDPNLSSFSQRAMTAEALKGLCEEFPNYFKTYNVLNRYLKTLRVNNIDEILIDPDNIPLPPATDVITENQNILNGIPVKAYIFQDQDSYIQSKIPFLQDQSLDPSVIQAFKANIAERVGFKYRLKMESQLGIQLPEDLSQLSPEEQNMIAKMVAEVSMREMQQQQDSSPTPGQIAMEELRVKEKEADIKAIEAQTAQIRVQLEQFKAESKKEADDRKLFLEELRLQFDKFKAAEEFRLKDYQINMDAQKEGFKVQTQVHLAEDRLNENRKED